MRELSIRDDAIKLGQALKLSGAAESGAEAKHAIEEGEVLVNGEKEKKRGRKLRDGDEITCGGQTWRVVSYAHTGP